MGWGWPADWVERDTPVPKPKLFAPLGLAVKKEVSMRLPEVRASQ